MKKVFFLLLILLLPASKLRASFKEYASERQKMDKNTAKITSPHSIPGFQTPSPPETNLNHAQTLDAATARVFIQNLEAQTLKRTAENRAYFVIDLANDPLIKNSKEPVQDPEKVLRSEIYSRNLKIDYTYKTCHESKPAIEFKCTSTLLPPSVHVDPAKYSHFWCKVGHHHPDDPQCKAKRYYPTPIMYEAEKIHVSPEAWTSDCGRIDKETKNRACKLVTQICPNGPETRQVMATIGPQRTPTARTITRPCWRYEYVYECAYPSVNTCEALRKSTCEQIQSKCLRELNGVCIEWEQTFRCPTHTHEEKERASAGAYTPPQADSAPTHLPNQDMPEALAKLSVLKEVQDDLRANADSQNMHSIQIFKGLSRSCTIAFGGFKNCCTKGKGWGVSLNLSHCDGGEKDLAERQKKGLCVKIGTYCAEKVLGVCIRKKTSHCCFPTKLARILQAQGRPQLGIGWGEPKQPQCRGFTVDELSRIDFDQLDLSELFAEIAARAKQITQTTVNVITRNLSDRVNQMGSDFKNPEFKTPTSTNKPKSGDF